MFQVGSRLLEVSEDDRLVARRLEYLAIHRGRRCVIIQNEDFWACHDLAPFSLTFSVNSLHWVNRHCRILARIDFYRATNRLRVVSEMK